MQVYAQTISHEGEDRDVLRRNYKGDERERTTANSLWEILMSKWKSESMSKKHEWNSNKFPRRKMAICYENFL